MVTDRNRPRADIERATLYGAASGGLGRVGPDRLEFALDLLDRNAKRRVARHPALDQVVRVDDGGVIAAEMAPDGGERVCGELLISPESAIRHTQAKPGCNRCDRHRRATTRKVHCYRRGSSEYADPTSASVALNQSRPDRPSIISGDIAGFLVGRDLIEHSTQGLSVNVGCRTGGCDPYYRSQPPMFFRRIDYSIYR